MNESEAPNNCQAGEARVLYKAGFAGRQRGCVLVPVSFVCSVRVSGVEGCLLTVTPSLPLFTRG